MAWETHWYPQVFAQVFGASAAGLDLAGATIKAALCTADYTPNPDTDIFYDDITNELDDASYDLVTLTGKAFTYDAATNTWKWVADPIVFADLTTATPFRTVVFFVDTGTPATSPLVAYSTHDTDITGSGSDVTLNPHADGITFITVT